MIGAGCQLQHALETSHVIHLGLECEATGLLDTCLTIPAHQTEQRIHSAHAGPGKWPFDHVVGKAADSRAVLGSLALEKADVAHRIGSLLRREVVRVDGPLACNPYADGF